MHTKAMSTECLQLKFTDGDVCIALESQGQPMGIIRHWDLREI